MGTGRPAVSERRQAVLIVAGLVTLVLVGIVAATLFPEPCESLVEVGELPLSFTDAADALPLSDEDATSVQLVGEELGIGAWRGAVALPDDARITSSELGFFVVTDQAFTVLRPSLGVVSAARGRAGLDVVSAGPSLALRAPDGEIGVYSGEFEQERCGRLPPDTEVLALDRGIAVLTDGDEVSAVTLSGDELFRAPKTVAAHVVEDTVVLGDLASVELRRISGGETFDRLGVSDASGPWVTAAGDRLLLRTEAGVLPVRIGDAGLEPEAPVSLPFATGAEVHVVATPAGIVASGPIADGQQTAALVTDRSDRVVRLPSIVSVESLHASSDGNVGILATTDGGRALLIYGRDSDE